MAEQKPVVFEYPCMCGHPKPEHYTFPLKPECNCCPGATIDSCMACDCYNYIPMDNLEYLQWHKNHQ
jgi:hypothetical protein